MADDTVNEITDVRRMRAAWDRGINYLASFYTMLDAKRKEIGDEAMSDWCFHELRISLSILLRISEVLEDSDKARVREELSRAVEIDRQKKAEEKRQSEERKHAEHMEREQRRLDRAKELREIAEKTLAEEQAAQKAKTTPVRTRRPAANNKTGGTTKPSNKSGGNSNLAGSGSDTIKPDPIISAALEVFINFTKKVQALRDEWVQASLVLAERMYKAKDNYPATQDLGKWLTANNLRKIAKDERAILIDMGANLEAAREAFDQNPDRTSLQGVWRGRVRNATNSTISEEDQEVSDIPHNRSVELPDGDPINKLPI